MADGHEQDVSGVVLRVCCRRLAWALVERERVVRSYLDDRTVPVVLWDWVPQVEVKTPYQSVEKGVTVHGSSVKRSRVKGQVGR